MAATNYFCLFRHAMAGATEIHDTVVYRGFSVTAQTPEEAAAMIGTRFKHEGQVFVLPEQEMWKTEFYVKAKTTYTASR